MRQYTGNRIGLAVVGALMLVIGGYAWARGQDRLPGLPSRAKVLPERVAELIAERPWALWLLALTLVLLALVTLRWLLISLGWGRLGARSGTGTAMLCVGLKDIEGLTRAGVRVMGNGARLRVSVTCPAAADVGAMVGKLDREIVGRIRREVQDDELDTLVRLHVRR
ncbi:hypothetical protein [Nonomuraea cavernae]|uniref:Alkaline shock response membrane anchor protein AmaP n=1 Tax=Nonomuraea cavernae TaxID=2045107 RepID=A0A917Z3D9_9ACTN|nr:hypothetical protein [Nonomuraea cavernae]MCA2188227.1 hypothetical protein [Nonomuraea cavernae]GGO73943.1 hypothetical protein GCM10012289_45450 [Nonomuraea cavernae]